LHAVRSNSLTLAAAGQSLSCFWSVLG